MDVLPTLLEIAGGKPDALPAVGAPPRPGRSLAPVLQTDSAAPHEYIYFNHNRHRAIRVKDWKAVSIGEEGPWESYDLNSDRSEQRDRSSENSDRLKQLASAWKLHDDEFVSQREQALPTSKKLMKPNAAAGG